MAVAAPPTSAAWNWLLGKVPGGGFRHAPFRATDPGQGQDPTLESRVEVIHRLIAYPVAAFETIVGAVMAADRDPKRPIRWVCHRASGDAPARPYWISFLRARPEGGRRFVVGLELFDRHQIGLWFFSGFVDRMIPPEAKAPFPDRPEVSLPRFLVSNENVGAKPFARWVPVAFEDALVFDVETGATMASVQASMAPQDQVTDASDPIERTLAPGYAEGEGAAGAAPEEVELRSARARLVICAPNTPPRIIPLARLAVSFGRDPRSDVIVDDRSVSGDHARIVWREGTPVVEELGSKNGTRVEDRVVRRGEHVPLPDEGLVAFGRVPCLFVRDAEETLPPGAQPVKRHEQRMRELLDQGKIRGDDAERARADAQARGITPGEALVLAGKVTPEVWRNRRPATEASDSTGCGVLLAAAAVGLGALLLAVLL